MPFRLNDLLLSQHQAALATLQKCVELCPEDCWNQKVANLPISTVAFHTLFWTDMYLERNTEHLQDQEFHKSNSEIFGEYEELNFERQVQTYTRAHVVSYLEFCRDKAAKVISAETEESFAEKSGFEWLDCSRAEVHVYSTRHIQHHASQISLRLRIDHGAEIPWVKQGA